VSTRIGFFALVVVLTITLVVICWLEPITGDAWGHYAVAARLPLTLERFEWVAETNYFHGNPRWGQLVLVAMLYAPVLAAIVSGLVIVGVLLLSMTLIRARWPRSREDGWLLLQVLATAIATTPQFGALWFYRANCSNYIYPLCVQLAWLVPYRFLAARSLVTPWWLAGLIIPIGVLAGAGNEHTGLGLAIAAVVCCYVAWCRDRTLPVWAFTGVASLVAGYITLLAAPGQQERYGGLANELGLVERIVERGVVGNLSVLAIFLAWTSPMLIVVAAIAYRGRWRPLTRVTWTTIAGFVAIAAVMFATVLVSPKVPARLLAAPATMVALALGVFMVELATQRGKARALRIASVVISGLALAMCLVIYVVNGLEGRERIRKLDAAPPGAVVCAPPYTFAVPTPFSVGDDFRSAVIVERVAHLYKVARIDRNCR
jgi:hypothetical protein